MAGTSTLPPMGLYACHRFFCLIARSLHCCQVSGQDSGSAGCAATTPSTRPPNPALFFSGVMEWPAAWPLSPTPHAPAQALTAVMRPMLCVAPVHSSHQQDPSPSILCGRADIGALQLLFLSLHPPPLFTPVSPTPSHHPYTGAYRARSAVVVHPVCPRTLWTVLRSLWRVRGCAGLPYMCDARTCDTRSIILPAPWSSCCLLVGVGAARAYAQLPCLVSQGCYAACCVPPAA